MSSYLKSLNLKLLMVLFFVDRHVSSVAAVSEEEKISELGHYLEKSDNNKGAVRRGTIDQEPPCDRLSNQPRSIIEYICRNRPNASIRCPDVCGVTTAGPTTRSTAGPTPRPEWVQIGATLVGDSGGNQYGYSVSLSSDGTRLAVGANQANGYAGSTSVYDLVGNQWLQVGNDIIGENGSDLAGGSVSLSSDGNRVAIGARQNDGNGSSSGHVRIYELSSGNAWIQVGSDIDGEFERDYSGRSVSLSSDGSIVAIGANENDGAGDNSGHVRIYTEVRGAWLQLGDDIDGESPYDQFGYSVSLSSDGYRLAVGARSNDGGGDGAGHVRVFDFVAGTWDQVGNDIDGESAGDASGYAVSLSDDRNRVAIGAFQNDGSVSNAGHVRVYELVGGTWTQVGDDIDGEGNTDWSGSSVSLSSDGSIVAIGAYRNNGADFDSGHVRVHKLDDGSWIQLGDDIDGIGLCDLSGFSVSLSSDGQTVAIGAIQNYYYGPGYVRAYAFN